MIEHPKISVLIPVYNRESFIAECIDSALTQDYPNFEVIVVDNCSTDKTLEICREIQKTDQRLHVYQNDENVGPVRNWMKCAERATGDYIKILFSDDILLPSALSLFIRPFINNKSTSIVFSSVKIGENLYKSNIYYTNLRSGFLSFDTYLHRLLVADVPYSPCAALIAKDRFQRNLKLHFESKLPVDFASHGAGPDCMLQVLAANEGGFVYQESTPLVFFRSHAGSLTFVNLKNEVRIGYLTAISGFLYQSYSRRLAFSFLFLAWLDAKKNQKIEEDLRFFWGRYFDKSEFPGFLSLLPSITRIVLARVKRRIYFQLANWK